MSVSLVYRVYRKDGTLGKEQRLNVGWGSMAYGLLNDNGLLGHIDSTDAERLRELAKTQLRGERDPPFDWSQDIAEAFNRLANETEKHSLLLEALF